MRVLHLIEADAKHEETSEHRMMMRSVVLTTVRPSSNNKDQHFASKFLLCLYFASLCRPMTTRLCPRAAPLAKRCQAIATSVHSPVRINAVAGPSRTITSPSGTSQRKFTSLARRKTHNVPRTQVRSYHYYTDVERGHERIIQTATSRVEEFDKASEAVSCAYPPPSTTGMSLYLMK